MGKRQYSDTDKGVALATLDACGGDVSKAAKALKMPAKTLENWAKGRGVNPEVAEIGEHKKRELADKLEEVAHALTGNILKRAESELSILVPMKDIATSLGIVVDKMQLLKGEATNITKELLPDAERERMKGELRHNLSLVQKSA